MLYDYAIACLNAGLAVVPPKEDGSKSPIGTWKRYQSELPSAADLARWYGQHSGIGFVTGAVSGNLEVLDFDSSAHFPQFLEWLEGYAGKELADKITINGCVESSPKGIHLFYRCPEIGKNSKLAMSAEGKVLIETRAEGGYIVAAPSNRKVNPAGTYAFIYNDHLSIPTISVEEREEIIAVASFFDSERMARIKPYVGMTERHKASTGSVLRPGEDYNERGDWQELLEGAGWSAVFERGECVYLVKPGSASRTHHATLNHGGSNLFYCFSSSAYPFEPDTSYSKFAVYALLHHGGDFDSAAGDLASKGFGSPYEASSEVIPWQTREKIDTADSLEQKWTGASLMKTDFPPLTYVVEPILPDSACIVLAGSPKVGKSFFVLDLCLCADSDGRRLLFGQYPVASCGTLYLALEDTPQSIRERLDRLAKPVLQFTRHVDPSDRMHIYFEWPRLGMGCIERIVQHLDAHPDTRLIVIDTLQLIRPPSRKGVNAYEIDYEIVAAFRKLAGEKKVCIVLLTHLRKDSDGGDPFEAITGSMGISGAADGSVVLKRAAGESLGKFYTRGRRVPDQAIQLRFDDCVWTYLADGDYGQVQHAVEIIECLHEHNGKWLSAAEVSAWLYKECGIKLSNPRRTMAQLVDKDVCAKEGSRYALYQKRR